MKMVVTVIAVIIVVSVAFVSCKNLFVITAVNWLPVFVFVKCPRMSIATNFNGSVGGNRSCFLFLFAVRRFLPHDWQVISVPYMSSAAWGQ